MSNRRKGYPEHRKYQSIPLKSLIRKIELDLMDLNTYILTTEQHQKRLKDVQERFFEIALRLD